MKDKIETVYCPISPSTVASARIRTGIAKDGAYDVVINMSDGTVVETTSSLTIGSVMDENNSVFSILQRKHSIEKAFWSLDNLRQHCGPDASLKGQIKFASGLNYICEVEAVKAKATAEKKTVEKHTSNAKKTHDFSAFGENADEIRNRVEYIRKLDGFVDSNGKKNAVMIEKVVDQYLAYMTKLLNGWPRKLAPLAEAFVDSNQVMSRCLKACLLRSNILLTGPKGTGKNKCVEQLASLMGLEHDCWQMFRTLDSADLLYYKNISNGEVVTKCSDFIESAKRPFLLVLDEINTAPASLLVSLHSFLDHRRNIHIPDVGSVSMNELSIVCGTMNEGYVGTEPLNEAFESRFHKVMFREDPKVMKFVFLQNGVGESEAALMSEYYTALHSAVKSGRTDIMLENPEQALNQRSFVRAAQDHVAFGTDVRQAIQSFVLDPLEDSDRLQIEEYLNTINLGTK